MKYLINTILIGLLICLSGCQILDDIFVDNDAGDVVANPSISKTVDNIGNAAGRLGVPYAGIAGELWVGITGVIALLLNDRRRVKEKRIADSVIRGVEISGSNDAKIGVRTASLKNGNYIDVEKRVAQLT